jgi:hypothetical protein
MRGLLQRRRTEQTPGGTSADISGSVSDSQLAIGDHIVQNNIAAGAIINQVAGEHVSHPPQPRSKPVSVKPREAPRLIGRDNELATAAAALAAHDPVQFSGRSGAGKTALLRHIAHGPGPVLPDGVIYYRSRRESLDDLLLRIFEFLYVSDARVKPTNAELCLYLEQTQALLLLDDVDIDREDLETLLSTLPRSVFVFGSPERSLWDEGAAIGLRGLGDDAALVLVEQYLGRPLASDEHHDFATLCRALDGQPLQIIKAVTQVREEGVPVAALVSSGSPFPSAPAQLNAQVAETLTPEARQALMLMAALAGAPLHVEHVAALTGAADGAALLADLEARGLAKSHSPRYSITDEPGGAIPTEAEAQWRRRLLSYFADHAEAHAHEPARLRDDLEPIIATLRGGAQDGEWRGVLRLARAADPAAAASKLWGAWATILGIALDAARQLGDEPQEAWALHQLGTRALCLGDADEAARRLGEALRIRERIGDHAAQITRHNMGQLPGAPPPPPSGEPPTGPIGPEGTPAWIPTLCVGLVAMVGVAGLVSPGLGDERPSYVRSAPWKISLLADKVRPGDASPADPRHRKPPPADGVGATPRGPGTNAASVEHSIPYVEGGVTPDNHHDTPDTPDTQRESPSKPDATPSDDHGSSGDPDRADIVGDPATDATPISKLAECTTESVDRLHALIEDEIAVLRSALQGQVPPAVQQQIEVLQRLVDHLANHCDPVQVNPVVSQIQDVLAGLTVNVRQLVAGL